MILAVDIGNSHIVVGGYEDEGCLFSVRMKTDSRKTEWEYAVAISQMLTLNGYSGKPAVGMAISSAVPALTGIFTQAADILAIKRVITVGPGVKTGLNIRIDDPGTLAADLACTAVGAIESYPLPAIIVDLGTATKILVVDKNRNFMGGAIMAGVMVSLSALSTSTAQLPQIGLTTAVKVIGTNTVDCMMSGSILGTASMIDGMIERYSSEMGGVASVIACGGLAHCIVPHCKSDIIMDKNLLLDGLMAIYRKNSN